MPEKLSFQQMLLAAKAEKSGQLIDTMAKEERVQSVQKLMFQDQLSVPQPATRMEPSVLEITASLGFNLPPGMGKPGTGTSAAVPLSGIERLEAKITSLQEQLQANAPGYAGLLHEIHQALAQDESLVHLLTEEKIGVIMAGLSKRKSVVIAEAVTKKTSSKALSKLGADDFG